MDKTSAKLLIQDLYAEVRAVKMLAESIDDSDAEVLTTDFRSIRMKLYTLRDLGYDVDSLILKLDYAETEVSRGRVPIEKLDELVREVEKLAIREAD
jgi:hypothetical protein